jgi:CheY-like chemotaxis protein
LVDPSALRQAILDLAAFACGGQNPAGSLTLSSSHAPDGASAPRGVCLTLARTGLLLDEAALQRLFVPFGRGDRAGALDGLALASAEGTIAQSGGSLLARQMPPGGLQLVLNLPAAPAMESQPEALQTEAHEPAPAATGTILLADDEELLRGVAVRILEEAGYRVLVARNGLEALELAHLHTGQVDLLLTDVVMPKMGGFELATRLRTRHPQLKILFMSGFSEGGLFPAQGERSGLMFLQKPFSPALLLSRIRSMMVERAPSNVAPAWRRDCPA